MKPWLLLPRLVAIFAIVGLLAAFSTPSSSATMSGFADLISGKAMAPAASMPAHMPCCPKQQPSAPDCGKSCPLALLCAANCFPGAPTDVAFVALRSIRAQQLAPIDDHERMRLNEPPPPRPPRA